MAIVSVTDVGTAAITGLLPGSRYVARVRRTNRGGGEASEWSRISRPQAVGQSGIASGQDIDLGTGKILYSNVYDTVADLPAAADYHGMFAHVHNYNGLGTGAAFYAHAGNWVRLADSDDVPTTLVSTVNGLSGSLILAGGQGTLISQSGNQLTISSTLSSTTINGQTGPVSLTGGNRIDISTSGGTITASANLSGYATESYVDSSVANLVNSAPAALDTLSELANALNNDSDFAANVTTLIGQKADASHSHVKANITDLTTSDLDLGGNRVLFANYYATQADFPSATTYHGMVAHSHADGAFYGAHAGSWVRLANYGDIPAGITWSTPPQNSSSPGDPGDVAYDDDYFYLRTSQAWRQVPLQPISTAITISQQPQNATVADGDSASFTVLATAGGETISYQWASSADGVTFSDLTGATTNTLTLNATLNDDGTQYRVLLSAAGASDVTSDVATLTVSETFRLLTANNDTLLTETGDTLNHDGVGAGGGLTFANVLRLYPMDEGYTSPGWDIGLDAVTQTPGWTRSAGHSDPQIVPAGKFGNFARFYDPLAGWNTAQEVYEVHISAAFGVNWTVECWLQRPVPEYEASIHYFGSNGASVLEVLGVAMIGVSGNQNDLGLFLYDGSASPVWQSVPGVQSFSDFSWVHVAIARESNTVRFYANGVQISYGSTSTANPTTLILGKYNVNNLATFGIDDLRITDGVVYPGGTTFTPPTAAHATS